jgi:hypothetical protein
MPGNAGMGNIYGKNRVLPQNLLTGRGSFSPSIPCIFIATVPYQLSATIEGTLNDVCTGIL